MLTRKPTHRHRGPKALTSAAGSPATCRRVVTSAEGHVFLARLTGRAVEDARTLLSSLPGCSQLAAHAGAGAGAPLPAENSFLKRRPAIARVRVKDYLASFSLDHFIEAGRQLRRKFVIHFGPTNQRQDLFRAEGSSQLSVRRISSITPPDPGGSDGACGKTGTAGPVD